MTDLRIPSPQGETRLFAVIGDPIAQVKVPPLMNAVFVERGLDAVMVPFHIRARELSAVLPGLKRLANLEGMLVTIPHKFEVCEWVEHLSDTVRVSGAANAIRREADGSWSAENFDGLGFVAGLRARGVEVEGKRIALVGTGGAGAAIAAALASSGVAFLGVSDIAVEKAREVTRRLENLGYSQVAAGAQPMLAGADIVINATPLGLRPEDPLPFSPDDLAQGTLVADIIMKPAETPLLKAAAKRGLGVHQGIHMLAPQIAMFCDYFKLGSKGKA